MGGGKREGKRERGELPHLQENILCTNGLAIGHCVLGALARLQNICIFPLLCLFPLLERSWLRIIWPFQRRCHQVNFLFTPTSFGRARTAIRFTATCCSDARSELSGGGKVHLLTRLVDHKGLALILAVTAAVEVAAAPIPIGVQQFLQLSQLVGIFKEGHSVSSAHFPRAYFIHSLFDSSLSYFSSCFFRIHSSTIVWEMNVFKPYEMFSEYSEAQIDFFAYLFFSPRYLGLVFVWPGVGEGEGQQLCNLFIMLTRQPEDYGVG